MLNTGHHGLVVSEVAREIDNAHARIFVVEADRYFECVVWGAIIDQDDFEIVGEFFGRGAHARIELRQIGRRIVHRGYDG